MANNNIEYSFEMSFETPQQAVQAQAMYDRWQTFQAKYYAYLGTAPGEIELPPLSKEDASVAIEIALFGMWLDGVRVAHESSESSTLWFYCLNNGNVDVAAALVQYFMETFNLSTPVGFTWSIRCDKPRINEFDGGGVVVTQDQVYSVVGRSWVDMTLEKIKDGTINDEDDL